MAGSGTGLTTFSGHTTRSTGASTNWLAATWFANTCAAPVGVARVRWGPPPWTRATSRVPTVVPVGATAVRTVAAANSPATTAIVVAEAPSALRPSARADSPTPMATVRATSRRGPATRTTGARGPPACPIAMVARGTPPNGTVHRTSSARVTVPTRPRRRHRPDGTRAVARPSHSPWSREAMAQPGGVRSTIQNMEGRAQARPATRPRPKRRPAGRSASDRSRRAIPQ